MSPVERRQALYETLCRRRFDTYANLAQEFCVSTKTIQRDVEILVCKYPIETVRGRYGGGVRVMGDHGLYDHSTEKKYLNQEQIALLMELGSSLSGHKLDVLNSIFSILLLDLHTAPWKSHSSTQVIHPATNFNRQDCEFTRATT